MTEHTKTDGLPRMDLPVIAESAGLGKAPPRSERMSTAKVECNACPVLCQISDGRTGACDRYANKDGVLVRSELVTIRPQPFNPGSGRDKRKRGNSGN